MLIVQPVPVQAVCVPTSTTHCVNLGDGLGHDIFVDRVSGTNITTVDVGDSIVWDELAEPLDLHNAQAGPCNMVSCTPTVGGFNTGLISKGNLSTPVTFNTAGQIPYFCAPHAPMMNGTINVLHKTTTIVQSSLNPAVLGQSVTFTATVASTSGGGPPVGTVNFFDNSLFMGSGTLSGGVATFPTSSLTSGVHSITATYNPTAPPTAFFDTSNASALSQTVQDYSIPISNSPLAAVPNQSVMFNGTLSTTTNYTSRLVTITCQSQGPNVTCTPPPPLTPSLAGTPFSVTVSASVAANYNFNIQGVSAVDSVTHLSPVELDIGNFSFSPPPATPITAVQTNPSTATTLQVQSLGSFAGLVTLSCPAPPTNVTCNFYPSPNVNLTAGQMANIIFNVDTGPGTPALPGQTVTINAASQGTPIQQRNVTLNVSGTDGTQPDLRVTVAHALSPDPTLLGSRVRFDIQVSNISFTPLCLNVSPALCAANGSSLLVTFSQPVSGIIASTGCNTSTNSVSCSLGTIASLGAQSVTISVPAPFARSLIMTVQASSNGADLNPANNIASGVTQVRFRPEARRNLPVMIP